MVILYKDGHLISQFTSASMRETCPPANWNDIPSWWSVYQNLNILSCASEVGSPMNHLGSRQRRDMGQGPFSPFMTNYLKLKNIDRLWTCFTKAGWAWHVTILFRYFLNDVGIIQHFTPQNAKKCWTFTMTGQARRMTASKRDVVYEVNLALPAGLVQPYTWGFNP